MSLLSELPEVPGESLNKGDSESKGVALEDRVVAGDAVSNKEGEVDTVEASEGAAVTDSAADGESF